MSDLVERERSLIRALRILAREIQSADGVVNAVIAESANVIEQTLDEIARLRRPATWQAEQAAVEAAFERSGVQRTWPDDEPDQIIPMVNAMADEIARLREAIRRIAEQDATLSACNGSVTVTMDATLTDAEPVAWIVSADGGESDYFTTDERKASHWRNAGLSVVQLYRQPQPTLTDAERELFPLVSRFCRGRRYHDWAEAIDGLLERLK